MLNKLSIQFPIRVMLVLFILTLAFIPLYIYSQKARFVDFEKNRINEIGMELPEILEKGDSDEIELYLEDKEAEDCHIHYRDEKGLMLYSNYKRKEKRQDFDEDKSSIPRFRFSSYSKDAMPLERTKDQGQGGYKIIELRRLCYLDGHKRYLYIRESLKSLDAVFSYTNRNMVLILVLYSAVSLFAIYWMTRRITRPIELISQVTQQVAREDYSVRYSGDIRKDEIGLLAENVNHMVNSIQDNVTSLNNYNFLLNNKIEMLSEREMLRKKMLTQLTHELKTPLAIISSQVEMIYSLEDENKKQEYYVHAMEEIRKMSRTISNVLKKNVDDNNIFTGKSVKTDLTSLLRKLIDGSRSYVISHGFKFEYYLDEDCIKYLCPEHVEHVFHNYLHNAIKHTKKAGKIIISLIKKENKIRLSVYNEGSFILDEDGERIWLEFITLSRNGNRSSTGLGLYIVKNIAILCRTECGYINHPGGVEFWFDFTDSPSQKAEER